MSTQKWSKKKGRDVMDRFTEKTRPEGDCLVWTGYTNPDGYGQFSYNGKDWGAHRFIWEYSMGPIPTGLVVDHMCRNKSCVRIEHLREVTCKVNVLENSVSIAATNAKKTHCPLGHVLDRKHTFENGSVMRICGECHREACRKNRRKMKEATQ